MVANHKLIAKNIFIYRNKRNLSQKSLAKLINMKSTSFSDIECGRKTTSFSRLIEIAEVLNVSVDNLLDGNLFYTSTDSKYDTDNLDKEILNNIRRLTAKEKEVMIRIFNTYINEVKNK